MWEARVCWEDVLGLCSKILVARGTAGMAFVRRHQKLQPHQTEPVPDSSKMDPPLSRAEPISDVGSAFVITYLRTGKNEYQIRVG